MRDKISSAVDLVWDLTRERLTVGGALVLRQEGEMLAMAQGREALAVHLLCNDAYKKSAEQLGQAIFGNSIYRFQFISSTQTKDGWPSAFDRNKSDFSHFSFSRIINLYSDSGFLPRLQWSKQKERLAHQFRRAFYGKLISVHLRFLAPFSQEESNANGYAWNEFFAEHAKPGVCNFVLVGDDPLPVGLELRPGVSRAAESKIDLSTQLALIGISDGFLGMASGLCTAANFSGTPYVIFKHPEHHATEMMNELGVSNAYPFAGDSQQLWRREANVTSLNEAFQLITS
jgi:hypothetical protein